LESLPTRTVAFIAGVPERDRVGRRVFGALPEPYLNGDLELGAEPAVVGHGRADALRALLSADRDPVPDFVGLANALPVLYPKESEEERLFDALLFVVPR
jgi:hypothetical protein